MADPIRLSVADRIATVTLDRPPVNAFNTEMFEAFNALLDGLERRADWSVLHIRSALKVFSAGADLAELSTHFASADKLAAAANITQPFQAPVSAHCRPATGQPRRDRRRGHGWRLRTDARLRPAHRGT